MAAFWQKFIHCQATNSVSLSYMQSCRLRMKKCLFLIPLLFIFYFSNCQLTPSPLEFKKVLCEYAEDPMGIGTNLPRFSWIVEGNLSGQIQTAFRIRMSSRPEGLDDGYSDQWDSGRMEDSHTMHHIYQGHLLKSNRTYYWQVTVWDNYGHQATSEIATFRTAFLKQSDWRAKWIGAGPAREVLPPGGFFMNARDQYALSDTVVHHGCSLLLRNRFDCPREIKSAHLYITGLGYYEAYINGLRIGDRVLSPAKTNYRRQVLYDTYDVTRLLRTGSNAIGIHLGNGWFNPYKRWWQEYRMQWFGAKRAIAQLEIIYQDSRSNYVITDENWKQTDGPVLYNCIYDGEIYDATKEIDGWSQADYDDTAWQPVTLMESPGGRLISQQMPPVKIVQTVKPVSVSEPEPETLVYDMGQNFSGWIRLAMKGDKGTTVTLRFAEDVHEDGSLNATSNEHARATAVYTMKGGDSEIYEPEFSFFGFKYVEITAEPALPEIENIEGCVVHSANGRTGHLETGSALINKIHRATVWSQKSNMIGYPLDCPQRDERLGWFGDAQVTAEEAMYNFDMALFYRNWLSGIRLNQDPKTGDIPIISPRPYIFDEGVEWSSTFFTISWDFYRYYGDKRLLEENYPAMIRYLSFLDSLSINFIVPMGWIGDWGSLVEGWQEGEPASIPTAYYYYDATIMAKIAGVLGKPDDQQKYLNLAAAIRNTYNKTYFDPLKGNYGDGSQMANAFPIYLGLVEEKYKDSVLNNLVADIVGNHAGHLTTGVLGSKYMIDALTMENRADIAWLLATATGYPSWSDMVEKYTTMCEFWTLKQSHNHVFTGSIDAWFYKSLAGIRLDEAHPAFKNIIIKPYFPENLSYAKASLETLAGTVRSSWRKLNKELVLTIEIPFNSTAKVSLPISENKQVLINQGSAVQAEGVRFERQEKGCQVYSTGSGKYTFKWKIE